MSVGHATGARITGDPGATWHDSATVTNLDTTVVMPVYNEAEVLPEVLAGLVGHVGRVVCVDDGSSDGSAAQVQRAGAVLVQHPINLGQGAALQTGFEYALRDPGMRWVITFDADGQHRVEDALAMLDMARSNQVDVVFGSRFLEDNSDITLLKRVVLKLALLYTNATSGVRLSDAHNGLRVLGRHAVESMDIRQSGMAHASEIVEAVGKAGLTYREAPIEILYTDYSKAKGQSVLNSVNILFDLWFR